MTDPTFTAADEPGTPLTIGLSHPQTPSSATSSDA